MTARAPVSTRYIPQRVTSAQDPRGTLNVRRDTTVQASAGFATNHRFQNDDKGKANITAALPQGLLDVPAGPLLDEQLVFVTRKARMVDGRMSHQRGALHQINHALRILTEAALADWGPELIKSAAMAGVTLNPVLELNSQDDLYRLYLNTKSSGHPPTAIYLCARAIWDEIAPFGVVFTKETDSEVGETAIVGGFASMQMVCLNSFMPGDVFWWVLKPVTGVNGKSGPFAFHMVATDGAAPSPGYCRYTDVFRNLCYAPTQKIGKCVGMEYTQPQPRVAATASGLNGTPMTSFTASKMLQACEVQLCASRGGPLWIPGLG